MSTVEIIRVILIFSIIVMFVAGMMSRKISTIIALPSMGILVAIIATMGLPELESGFFGLFSPVIDETTGEVLGNATGILGQVFVNGSKAMISSITVAIAGGAFAVLIKKSGLAEGIVKNAAELSGEKPFFVAMTFFVISIIIFTVPMGLGGVILVGSIMLPILMTAGYSGTVSAAILLIGMSTGGCMNVGNWQVYTDIVSGEGVSSEEAYRMTVAIATIGFFVSTILGTIFIYFQSRKLTVRNWGNKEGKNWWIDEDGKVNINPLAYLAPIIPVAIVLGCTIAGVSFPAEIAIIIGMVWLVIFAKMRKPGQQFTKAFVEGTQSVSGAIVLLIGLGIMLNGFKYATVTPLMESAMAPILGIFASPFGMVFGFTLLTPLVLYRGPLNTWGIGAALMPVFIAAGFPPQAYLAAIYSFGIFQGYGDPTNSQNIWASDFSQVEPFTITRSTILLGYSTSFFVLLFSVIIFQFEFNSTILTSTIETIFENKSLLIEKLGGVISYV